MSVSDRVPDRVSAVGSSDTAKIIGLLAVIYAVYLVLGSVAGRLEVAPLKHAALLALGDVAHAESPSSTASEIW